MALPKQYRFKADALPADMYPTNAALRRLGVMKVEGYQFNAADLDQYGLEEVLPHSSGDVRTGKCVMDQQLGYLVPEFVAYTKDTQKAQAKQQRNDSDTAPISVTVSAGVVSFDLHEKAKENILGTIEDFEPIRAKFVAEFSWPDDGTIPWIAADNSQVAVTLADLQAVRLAAKLRTVDTHMAYQAMKAQIDGV